MGWEGTTKMKTKGISRVEGNRGRNRKKRETGVFVTSFPPFSRSSDCCMTKCVTSSLTICFRVCASFHDTGSSRSGIEQKTMRKLRSISVRRTSSLLLNLSWSLALDTRPQEVESTKPRGSPVSLLGESGPLSLLCLVGSLFPPISHLPNS